MTGITSIIGYLLYTCQFYGRYSQDSLSQKLAYYVSLTSPNTKSSCASESVGDLSYMRVHRLSQKNDKDKTVWLLILIILS